LAYNAAFASEQKLITPCIDSKSTHVFHQYTLRLKGIDRDALKAYLAEREIPAMIYYPVPLHMQKAYIDERYQEGQFPITEELCHEVVSLPMSPNLDKEQITYITKNIKEFLAQN